MKYLGPGQRAPRKREFCERCEQETEHAYYRFKRGGREGTERKCLRCVRRWNRSERGKEVKARYAEAMKGSRALRLLRRLQGERRPPNPRKRAARNAVQRAVAAGRMVRPTTCAACGQEDAIEGHHYLGYAWSNRLDVRWLCPGCHALADLPATFVGGVSRLYGPSASGWPDDIRSHARLVVAQAKAVHALAAMFTVGGGGANGRVDTRAGASGRE